MVHDESTELTIQPTNNQDLEHATKEIAGADPALQYTDAEVIEFTAEEEASVLRKIDWHILPLLCWVYCVQFADKTTLNYASLMGIRTDTGLVGQQYSWASSIFYAGVYNIPQPNDTMS